MNHGGRLTRWITAVLLAVGIAVVAPPAHASGPSSPQHAVIRFLHLVETGHGTQAYLEVQPSCRTSKGRHQLETASLKIEKLHAHFYIKGYRDSVQQGRARVSYTLYAVIKGVTKNLGTARGEQWVRIGNSWFMACHRAA